MALPFLEFGPLRQAPDRVQEIDPDTEDARIDAFLEIEAIDKKLDKKRGIDAKTKEILHNLFEMVEESVERYANAIVRQQKDFDHREDAAQSDESRRIAHNALMDNLNILARNYRQYGLDTRWRNEIGTDRDRVREWAQIVMKYIANEAEREEKQK